MIQVLHRPGSRSLSHKGIGGSNPENLTKCGRWLRGARRAHMSEAEYRALGDRRCFHCARPRTRRRR